jgi:imidazolonepropionase-like amidohydrolase
MAQAPASSVVAIKAGRLIDPETGTAATGQVIILKARRSRPWRESGDSSGSKVIDLSTLTVLPAGRCAHAHGDYLQGAARTTITTLLTSWSLRPAGHPGSLERYSTTELGFTVVRDVGNNALYADTALRQAIEQGWLPGPM